MTFVLNTRNYFKLSTLSLHWRNTGSVFSGSCSAGNNEDDKSSWPRILRHTRPVHSAYSDEWRHVGNMSMVEMRTSPKSTLIWCFYIKNKNVVLIYKTHVGLCIMHVFKLARITIIDVLTFARIYDWLLCCSLKYIELGYLLYISCGTLQ